MATNLLLHEIPKARTSYIGALLNYPCLIKIWEERWLHDHCCIRFSKKGGDIIHNPSRHKKCRENEWDMINLVNLVSQSRFRLVASSQIHSFPIHAFC
jgi:hypothetical protein